MFVLISIWQSLITLQTHTLLRTSFNQLKSRQIQQTLSMFVSWKLPSVTLTIWSTGGGRRSQDSDPRVLPIQSPSKWKRDPVNPPEGREPKRVGGKRRSLPSTQRLTQLRRTKHLRSLNSYFFRLLNPRLTILEPRPSSELFLVNQVVTYRLNPSVIWRSGLWDVDLTLPEPVRTLNLSLYTDSSQGPGVVQTKNK